MESIKELRVMLQTNVLGHPILQRVPSIYLTRLLLPTPVTSIQVSVAMIVVGVSAGAVAALGYIWAGLALIYLSLVLDAVDGEIVRYKKNYSVRGVYLDLVNHIVVFGAFFFGLTVGVSEAWSVPNIPLLIVGSLGALAMVMRRANGDLYRIIFVRPYRERPEIFKIPPHTPAAGRTEAVRESFSLRRSVRFLLWCAHELHEGGYLIVTLAVAYGAEVLLFGGVPHHPVLSWVIVAYAVTSCVYLAREIASEFRLIEGRLAALDDRFQLK